MGPLTSSLLEPLEREYEGWIVQQIEDYFELLEMPVSIWAVSPRSEAAWSADEAGVVGGRLFGLQLKRPKVQRPPREQAVAHTRIKWELDKPVRQLPQILARQEIYYCLPTFMNRRWRGTALHHCLFWRPINEKSKVAWYHNSNARTKYQSIRGAMRWSLFIEGLLAHQIGRPVADAAEAIGYVKGLLAEMRMPGAMPMSGSLRTAPGPEEREERPESPVYVVHVGVDDHRD